MELHFCTQCGISIPLAEVQSGSAGGVAGRYVCAEHRAGPKPAAPAGAAKPGDVELLFCANCKVSVPQADVDAGRAKREFGSLVCAHCSAADTTERDRRRRAVELEMAGDAPARPADSGDTRRCRVCSALVPQAQISAGRALIDGDRVVCPRCRDAGASPFAPASRAPATAGAGTGSGAGGNWALVGLLVLALGAVGFFGTEYIRARKAPETPIASAKELDELRRTMQLRMGELEDALAAQREAPQGVTRDELDQIKARVDETVLAVREDLADVRGRLTAADGDLAQRIARLEGQIAGLQEMIKGLASRPVSEPPRGPTGSDPGTGGGGGGPVVQTPPPEGPPPEGPRPAPPPQPNAEVTRLIKTLLEAKEVGDRFTAATELIRLKERSAISAFVKVMLDDDNVMVRRAGASGLGDVKAWNAVPNLIQALEDKEAYVAQKANFSLQAITGQDFGVTMDHSLRDRKSKAAAATRWWEKNKDNPPDGVCLEPIVLPK